MYPKQIRPSAIALSQPPLKRLPIGLVLASLIFFGLLSFVQKDNPRHLGHACLLDKAGYFSFPKHREPSFRLEKITLSKKELLKTLPALTFAALGLLLIGGLLSYFWILRRSLPLATLEKEESTLLSFIKWWSWLLDFNHTNQEGATALYIAAEKGYSSVVALLLTYRAVEISKLAKNGLTPFDIACQKGYSGVVKEMLKDPRVKVNEPDKQGYTPLHIACRGGESQVAKLLLQDPRVVANQASYDEFTPLLIASMRNCGKITKMLRGVDGLKSNTRYEDGKPPLYIAAAQGLAAVVKVLLALTDIEVNPIVGKGYTPLHIACQEGHREVVKLLLACSKTLVNPREDSGKTPFYLACEAGHSDVISLLLGDNQVEINAADHLGRTPFYSASAHGNYRVVQLLLEDQRVEINRADHQEKTPLAITAEKGHSKVIRLIEQRLACLKRALQQAATRGNDQQVKKLLQDARVEINQHLDQQGNTALSIACQKRHWTVVRLLLGNKRVNRFLAPDNQQAPYTMAKPYLGEEIDRLFPSGNNPNLCKACAEGRVAEVQMLLDDSEIVSSQRDGPPFLYLACEGGHSSVVSLLLRYKEVAVNQPGSQGKTPLYIACENGHFQVVERLLNHKREEHPLALNQLAYNGRGPLTIACEKEYWKIVERLLQDQRVDRFLERGKTPYQLLKQQKSDQAKAMLAYFPEGGKPTIHDACQQGRVTEVSLWLRRWINLSNRNKERKTPFYIACEQGHAEVVKL